VFDKCQGPVAGCARAVGVLVLSLDPPVKSPEFVGI
jgi:hypothetical protein